MATYEELIAVTSSLHNLITTSPEGYTFRDALKDNAKGWEVELSRPRNSVLRTVVDPLTEGQLSNCFAIANEEA